MSSNAICDDIDIFWVDAQVIESLKPKL